jgi:hypothetical protein
LAPGWREACGESTRYVFMTERGAPMTTAGFRKLATRIGAARARNGHDYARRLPGISKP